MKQRSRALTATRNDLTDGVWHDMVGQAFPPKYPWLTAASELSIESNDAADTAAGLGAQDVEMTLLDAAFKSTIRTVALNGVTPVSIPGGPYFRCNGMRIVQAGATSEDGGSVGRIKLTADTGGDVLARIRQNGTVFGGCIYTVSNNVRVDLLEMQVEVHRPRQAVQATLTGAFMSRRPGETAWNEEVETREMSEEYPTSSASLRDFEFSVGTDLCVRALTNADLSKAFARLLLYEDTGVATRP